MPSYFFDQKQNVLIVVEANSEGARVLNALLTESVSQAAPRFYGKSQIEVVEETQSNRGRKPGRPKKKATEDRRKKKRITKKIRDRIIELRSAGKNSEQIAGDIGFDLTRTNEMIEAITRQNAFSDDPINDTPDED